jgi:hypothetical protein
MLAKFVTVGGATVWLFGQAARAHVSSLTINGQRATDTLEAIRAPSVAELNRGNQRHQVSFDAWLSAGSEALNLAAFAAAQTSLAANGDFYLVDPATGANFKLASSQVQLALTRNLGATWLVRVSVTGGAWISAGVSLPAGFAAITGTNTSVTVAVAGLTSAGNVRASQIDVGTGGYTQWSVTCAAGQFIIEVPQAPQLTPGDGRTFNFSWDVVSLA